MLDSTKATSAPRPLPPRGPARRAERLPIREDLAVQLDGTRVVLIDLSPVGAQVLSSTFLRPGQHVRMSVADKETALRCVATVVWVWYEGPSARGITGYRAGLYFVNADREGIAAFGARNRRVLDSVKPNAPPMTPPRVAAGTAPRRVPRAKVQQPRRRAERLTVDEGVDVKLDGNPAMLVDLSPTGAQVLSPTALWPGQRVSMSGAYKETALRLVATVVWSWYEGPNARGITGYRAGLYFVNADRERIAAFGTQNRRVLGSAKPIAPPMTPPRVAAGPAPRPVPRAKVQQERRWTERLTVHEGVAVQLDGSPAMLVDLSTTGAQVLSPKIVRPGRRVWMSMMDEGARPFATTVVWSSFEWPRGKEIPEYRAGVTFSDADRDRVAAWCTRNHKPPDDLKPVEEPKTSASVAAGAVPPRVRRSGSRDARRAERLTVREGVVVQLDGNPSVLADLSTTGAQVVSPTVLQPTQRVQMSMTDEGAALQFAASVVWASLARSRDDGTMGYRAGVTFLDADRERVAAFCMRNRKITAAPPLAASTELQSTPAEVAVPVEARRDPEGVASESDWPPLDPDATAVPAAPKKKAARKPNAKRAKAPKKKAARKPSAKPAKAP